MIRRSYLMRRPRDDDNDEFSDPGGSSHYEGSSFRPKSYHKNEHGNDSIVVPAKPIDMRILQKLGPDFGHGRDFVRASPDSQKKFYGTSQLKRLGHSDESSIGGHSYDCDSLTSGCMTSNSLSFRPLTHDERNKLSAKILKAEFRGDNDLVKRLKQKLADGVTTTVDGIGVGTGTNRNCRSGTVSEQERHKSNNNGEGDVLLIKMDKRTGMIEPIRSSEISSSSPYACPSKPLPNKIGCQQQQQKLSSSSPHPTKLRGTVDLAYRREQDLESLVAEERATTAEDQLSMFGRATRVCADNPTDEDWVVDDSVMVHPRKRRHAERDTKTAERKCISEHRAVERTLDTCPLCIDSKFLAKHTIVATGLKTYLAVVQLDNNGARDGHPSGAGCLSDEHCFIAPMGHYASSLVLDEDVYEEMRLWRKGLVAMWRTNNNQDCLFVENTVANRRHNNGHLTVECIPVPGHCGNMAPIYFKKAIMDCEKEWADNKKLIDLSKSRNGVRTAIPRGFQFVSVDFGLEPGYAHVIEHPETFPSHFAQEIVAGMLDLPMDTWRRRASSKQSQQQHHQQQQLFARVKRRRDLLRAKWAPFDWTEYVMERISGCEGVDIGQQEKGHHGPPDTTTVKHCEQG